jgi:ribonuclease BN (tRNA processing enzyme)
VQAGHREPVPLGQCEAGPGVLLDDSAFRIRAVTLDHGTPVLAFAFEPPRTINIRKDRLLSLGLPVGPWLGVLKCCVAEDRLQARISLPDGRREAAGPLAAELVRVTPGKKLVYATDFADTPGNRARLTALAEGAHTLFCEAVFLEADARQAASTGHLTARACGELGTAAAVERLVPFHFSRRYEGEPAQVYDEVRAVCPQTLVPKCRDQD